MITINNVVLSVLVCLENEAVRNEISKDYEIKIKKLKHYNDYITCEEFKTKVINDINFNNCVAYTIKKLNDNSFRLFVEKSNICFIAFYKKEKTEKDMLLVKTRSTANIMSSLKSIIDSYYIKDEILYICVNPVKLFKDRVLENKETIIKYFNDNGKTVNDLKVKFIHKGNELDSLSETFLDLGFTIK